MSCSLAQGVGGGLPGSAFYSGRPSRKAQTEVTGEGRPFCVKRCSDSRRYRSLRGADSFVGSDRKVVPGEDLRQCSHQFPENRASPMQGHPFQHIELADVTEV